MSKPVINISLTTLDKKMAKVPALFDSGSFYTIVREDCLPKTTTILRYKTVESFKTAAKEGRLRVTGETILTITIGKKVIRDSVLVSPDLSREMLVGAKTMQAWDITIKNSNGHTTVIVGRDMRDPEITEVD